MDYDFTPFLETCSLAGGFFVLTWIAALGRMKREGRRAHELTDEISMLLADFGRERALDRLREYRGPYWFACTEVLRAEAHDERGTALQEDMARGVAGRAGGPWDVLVSLLVVVFVGGGLFFPCALCCGLAQYGPIVLDWSGESRRLSVLASASAILLGLAVLGLFAMSSLRRCRCRLASEIAALLQRLSVAAQSAKGEPSELPPKME